MGRGGYLGGHTIINVNRKDPQQIKKDAAKKAREQRELLHVIIDAELNGHTIKKVPRAYMRALGKNIAAKGGMHQWAQAQAKYATLKAKKVRKRNKKTDL